MKDILSAFHAFRPHHQSLAAARAARHVEYLRNLAQTPCTDSTKEAALMDEIRRDLVQPGHREVVPRIWHELEGEAAAELLRQRVELATEVWRHGSTQLVAIMVVYIVKVTCLQERNYFVPLNDRAGRLPECRAIAKAAGATSVVLDPHVYAPRQLDLVTPRALHDRSIGLLKFPFGCGRIPAPLAEPLLLQAGPEAEWRAAVKVGVAVYPTDAPTLVREPAQQSEMNRSRYVCEIAFPLSAEKVVAAKGVPLIKCVGVFGWHEGLRTACAAERRYRLGHQAFLGDSSRFLLARSR